MPRRKPLSISTGRRPPTAATMSGSASIVDRPLSSAPRNVGFSPARARKVGLGAGGRVPAAKSEWLMLVQSGDLGGRVGTARSAFCGPIALSPERGSTPKRLAKPCHLVLSTLLPAAAAGWPSVARWVENCLK